MPSKRMLAEDAIHIFSCECFKGMHDFDGEKRWGLRLWECVEGRQQDRGFYLLADLVERARFLDARVRGGRTLRRRNAALRARVKRAVRIASKITRRR